MDSRFVGLRANWVYCASTTSTPAAFPRYCSSIIMIQWSICPFTHILYRTNPDESRSGVGWCTSFFAFFPTPSRLCTDQASLQSLQTCHSLELGWSVFLVIWWPSLSGGIGFKTRWCTASSLLQCRDLFQRRKYGLHAYLLIFFWWVLPYIIIRDDGDSCVDVAYSDLRFLLYHTTFAC